MVLFCASVQSIFRELWGYFVQLTRGSWKPLYWRPAFQPLGWFSPSSYSAGSHLAKPVLAAPQTGFFLETQYESMWPKISHDIAFYIEYKGTPAVIRAYRWCITAINILTLFATMHCPSLACNSTLNGLKNDRTWLIMALHTVYFIFWLNAMHKISH